MSNINQIFEWTIVLILIIFLLYISYKIKNEFKNYSKNKKLIKLKHFNFFVPSWWEPVKDKNKIKFRSKSSQEIWYSSVEVIQSEYNGLKPENMLEKQIEKIHIIFDHDHITYKNKLPGNNSNLKENHKLNFILKEGTGTENESRRIYLQIAIVQHKEEPNYYLITENLSPVLEGGIEGPYFEELIKSIHLINTKHA